MLKRNNVLVLSHYTKKTLNRYMEIPASVQVGSTRGLFQGLIKIGLE